MTNINELQKEYKELNKALEIHFAKYDELSENVSDEILDELDDQAENIYDRLDEITAYLERSIAPILKKQDASVNDETIRHMFVFKKEKTVNLAFKLLKLSA